MRIVKIVAALAAVLSLTACNTFSEMGTSDRFQQQPAPLQAQPVGQVQGSQLPDPNAQPGQVAGQVGGQVQGQPGTTPLNANGFPAAPNAAGATGPVVAANGAVPANALDVKKETMVGNWKATSGGLTCDMFLTLTNLGQGSRGGTRGCAGVLQGMGSWEVNGKAVLIKDRSGSQIGSLYKTADNRYDGALSSGQPVSLSR